MKRAQPYPNQAAVLIQVPPTVGMEIGKAIQARETKRERFQDHSQTPHSQERFVTPSAAQTAKLDALLRAASERNL